MKYRKFVSITIVFTLTTIISSTFYASASRTEENSGASRIVEATGDVELKPRSQDFRPTGIGEVLGDGERLRLGEGAIVKVICNTGRSWIVPPGTTSLVTDGCPGTPPITRTATLSRPGGNNPQLPYVISPRLTYLLTDKPTLKWNEVEGATSYTVRIEREIGEIRELLWQKTVTLTEIDYPENEQPLKWGRRYLVTVEASNGASSRNDAGGNLGFEVVRKTVIERVKETKTSIENNSQGEDRAIALAGLYEDEKLIKNAIDTLQEMAVQDSEYPLIYLMLGEFYGLSGLNVQAEANYETALQLLLTSQHPYSLAKTQAKLAEVKLILGKKDEAQQLLNQAKAGYEASAASQEVDEIEERLNELEIQNENEQSVPPNGILTPTDLLE